MGRLSCLSDVLEIQGMQQQRPAPTSTAINNDQHGTSYMLLTGRWKGEGGRGSVCLKGFRNCSFYSYLEKIKTNLGWWEAKEGLGTAISKKGYYFLN